MKPDLLFQSSFSKKGEKMSVEPETIFSAVLIFMWVEFLWEALLSSRQRTIYKVGERFVDPIFAHLNNIFFFLSLAANWKPNFR